MNKQKQLTTEELMLHFVLGKPKAEDSMSFESLAAQLADADKHSPLRAVVTVDALEEFYKKGVQHDS